MICDDPGHGYRLDVFDGNGTEKEPLVFMKREGPGYPFNIGHYPGTNCQEVLRALIDRVKYLDTQIACVENAMILTNLRSALLCFEMRAARRHGRELPALCIDVENLPTCPKCGHIGCVAHTGGD